MVLEEREYPEERRKVFHLYKYIDMMDSTTFIIVSHQVFLTEREIHTMEVCVE